MKIKKNLIKREIAGDVILVPVGKSVCESNGLFALNELGAFIWDILPQAEDEAAICRAILGQYDAPAQEVAADVAAFLDSLRKLDII